MCLTLSEKWMVDGLWGGEGGGNKWGEGVGSEFGMEIEKKIAF